MDGQITVLAGTTFSEFVERHRPELVRVLALAGGSTEAAAAAVDVALLRAERRWDRIDGDPSVWVIDRAVKELTLPPDARPPSGMEHLPISERLDAILVSYMEWRPSRRAAAGAVPTNHAERYADIVAAGLAEMGPIPPRSVRASRPFLRAAGVVVAIASGAAALIVAGNLGGPTPLASIPTLPPIEDLEPIDEVRESRLLASPQLEWSTPLGVSAAQFVQIGASTVGYSDSTSGVRAWSTVNGETWIDHGIVIDGTVSAVQITEGGPGALAVVTNADRRQGKVRLYSSADGVAWDRHDSEVIDAATGVTIVGSSTQVVVINTWHDASLEWTDLAMERLSDADRAVAEEYGGWTQGTDFVILGPMQGIAKRVPLVDLGLEPEAVSARSEVQESAWYSSNLIDWSPLDQRVNLIERFGEPVMGAALPGGEVVIPATSDGNGYVVTDADRGTSIVTANRWVTSLRPFANRWVTSLRPLGDGVVGVSGAYPVNQIVASTDLVEWTRISPDLVGAIEPSPSRVEISTGTMGLLAAFTRLTWDASVATRTEVHAADLVLVSIPGSGLAVTRGNDIVANLISLQDERLLIHDLANRTVTILQPTTLEPVVTISFETAAKLVPAQVFNVDERVQLLFSANSVEWSVEEPPFYSGGPIRMTDLHVGNGMVIVAAEETAFPYSGTHVLVGRFGQPE